MADLIDKIDDLICTFDGTLNTTLDTLAMYIFGVFLFILLILVLSFHIYGKYRKPKCAVTAEKPPGANVVDQKLVKEIPKNVEPLSTGKTVPSSPSVRKRLGSKSGKIANITPLKLKPSIQIPSATGSDAESVKWVNDFFQWLYSDMVVVNELTNVWIQSLNETMKPSVAEVCKCRLLFYVLKLTQEPII